MRLFSGLWFLWQKHTHSYRPHLEKTDFNKEDLLWGGVSLHKLRVQMGYKVNFLDLNYKVYLLKLLQK